MIICRSRGFIFLRVPKTASTSLSAHICDHINFDRNVDAYSRFFNQPSFNIHGENESRNEHATLSNFLKSRILDERDLVSLKVYGVLRNPVERTVSMFSHVLKMINANTNALTNNQIVEMGLELFHSSPKKYYFSRFANDAENKQFYPLLPQSNWLLHYGNAISNIVIYPNFSKFLFDITSNSNLQYRYKEGANIISANIDPQLVKELRKIYPQDFVLWEKYGTKNGSPRSY